MSQINGIVLVGVTAVIVGAGGFYAGTKYQQSQSQRRFTPGNSQTRENMPNRTGEARGMITGEVSVKDDKSLTLKMTDGSSKIILLGASTKYHISSEAKIEEIGVGTKVAVNGTVASDGTITASNIEINPVQWLLNNK